MEHTIAPEKKEIGRNRLSSMIRMFSSGKATDKDGKESSLTLIKESKKNRIAVNNEKILEKQTESKDNTEQEQKENEFFNQELNKHMAQTNSGKNPEEESEAKYMSQPLQSENEVNTLQNMNKAEEADFIQESPGESIPTVTTHEDLQTVDEDSNKTTEENVTSEEASSIESVNDVSDEVYSISVDDLTQQESSSTTEDETLQKRATTPSNRTVQPTTNYTSKAKAKTANSQQKSSNSAVSLGHNQQTTGKASRSSLYSTGPSTSSLYHLTELSQPKPEALRRTLNYLRQLHGKDAEQLVSIERHLRGLRRGPKTKAEHKPATNTGTRKKPNNSTHSQTKPTKTDDTDALCDRQAFDKFAANLFAQLERKRALENYEVAKLQIPVELGYYRAAYDALVTAFGQPYHKCTLELYQQLAAELGMEAEMFVIDKTPNVVA